MTILIRLALAGMISVLAPVFIMGAAAAADLAILGAKIYPTPDSAPIDDGVVVLSDGRIEAVGPRSKVAIPRNARRIDAKGAVLMAGFWNSHIHLMPENLLNAATAKAETLQGGLEAMLTRWGFTSVFDIASATDNALALRARINSGEIAGPMLLTVGAPFYPKDGTPIYVRQYFKAHGVPNAEVATPEEAAARAAQQLDQGTDGVKLFAGAIVPARGHHAVAWLQVGDAGADALDDARDFRRRRKRERRFDLIFALDHQQVEKVQRRRFDRDHGLTGFGDGVRYVGQHEVVGAAILRTKDGFHGHT